MFKTPTSLLISFIALGALQAHADVPGLGGEPLPKGVQPIRIETDEDMDGIFDERHLFKYSPTGQVIEERVEHLTDGKWTELYVDTMTYDSQDRLVRLEDRSSFNEGSTQAWEYSYDDQGRLKSVKLFAWVPDLYKISEYFYAGDSRKPYSVIENEVGGPKEIDITRLLFDQRGKLIKRTEELKGMAPYFAVSYLYDKNGRLLRETKDYKGDGIDDESRIYRYDSLGRETTQEVVDLLDKKRSVRRRLKSYYHADGKLAQVVVDGDPARELGGGARDELEPADGKPDAVIRYFY